MISRDSRTFIHRVDSEGRLSFVNDDWVDFAVENGAPELSRDRILAKPLRRFISDAETRHVFDLLTLRVRKGPSTINVAFRCDSSNVRRFMTMAVSQYGSSGVEYACRVLRMETRPPQPLLEAGIARSDAFVRVCSWCKRVHSGEQGWTEVEVAIEQLNLLAAADPPQMTHGMCPSCLEAVNRSRNRPPA